MEYAARATFFRAALGATPVLRAPRCHEARIYTATHSACFIAPPPNQHGAAGKNARDASGAPHRYAATCALLFRYARLPGHYMP